MDILHSDRIRLEILRALRQHGEMTVNGLKTRTRTPSYAAVKKACNFLRALGLVRLEEKVAGSRRYLYVRLTDIGERVADSLR